MYKLLPLLLLFASCRTTKTVEKTRIVTDSTATEQVKVLEKKLDSTVASYEKKLSEVSETGVVFETEPCPDKVVSLEDLKQLISDRKIIGGTAYMDSLGNIYTGYPPKPVNTVHFNPNGSLKSASGNIKSVNLKTEKILQENADLKQVITTLRDSLANKKVELVKDEKKVDKQVERGVPWGFYISLLLIGGVLGWVARWKLWPYIKRLLKLKP